MPRQLAILFPNGTTEYWLTARTFEAGDTVTRNGTRWIVTSIPTPAGVQTRTVDGDHRHATVTLRADGDAKPTEWTLLTPLHEAPDDRARIVERDGLQPLKYSSR